MANELNIILDALTDTGLSVSAKVRQAGGTQIGPTVTMVEANAGFYTGDFALGAVADGLYSVEFVDDDSATLLGRGDLSVKNNSEYDLHNQNDFNPTSDTVASVTLVGTTTTNTDMVDVSAIPTNTLLTNDARLDNLDATISSRNSIAPNTVVPDNAGIIANGVAIGNLNDFNPAVTNVTTDTASREASKATTTISSNMRGTDGANTVAPDNATTIAINSVTSNMMRVDKDSGLITGTVLNISKGV